MFFLYFLTNIPATFSFFDNEILSKCAKIDMDSIILLLGGTSYATSSTSLAD
ncbi:hypothetical protein FC82_GL000193 [Secundilactobacillus collinoides DSM 20515 = JCM 1123]|uniref:Uncharacterized protein n=1 Tax=Secundilactobacillus collinoides DSM 20515 = JCM 1123 TaxID=1423733 RepID=A0A0R2B4W2_SECCO|nr:hypothetical protein FC82_GL000193 [Secundilactobacillus collinoides DSM 20515 = JCM 1123]